MVIFALTIFLSAFLLFLIQPLIARMILPWFGGTAAVWTTCLMFFQTTLLLGYLYADWSTRRLRPRTQALLHIALLFVSLLALPILPSAGWRPSGYEQPGLRIVLLLAVTVGGPYLLLSTTGPLLQAWYAALHTGRLPYRLYALSNAGSLLALLGFPIVVEPLLKSSTQAYAWSVAYVLFALLCGAVAWRVASSTRSVIATREPAPGSHPLRISEHLVWIGLAFCPSVLLLAITSHLSQNIAPIPLLWILPLSLYLLSLVLCFDSDRWYGRRWWLLLFVVFTGGTGYALSTENANIDIRVLIPLFAIALLCSCMVCHGELARRKPGPEWLTSFYLMLALGGALGGLFVGFLAPALFHSYLELRIGLLVCVALISGLLYRDRQAHRTTWFIPVQLASAIIVGMLAYQLAIAHPRWEKEQRLVVRNFYGQLLVRDQAATEDEPAGRKLLHGTILHGTQYADPEYRKKPSTYYCETSGVGHALNDRSRSGPVRVGVVGLGVGTLAAYGRSGDLFRFYEINDLVKDIAQSQFTYIQDCPAKLDIVLGDARRSLEVQDPQGYDLLVIDAFSGDSIPVHLLTREAFHQYYRHLNPHGILAIHISNRYLNLEGVVNRQAQNLGTPAILIVDAEEDEICSKSDWMLIGRDPLAFESAAWKKVAQPAQPFATGRLWTDDYSNLLQAIKQPRVN
ncbi:MAG: fused MFS/spermidine synthase [Acidobacteriota bacterium]|nr:fused MFS/spermidine synthase [Acidobacteriota bacterium]